MPPGQGGTSHGAAVAGARRRRVRQQGVTEGADIGDQALGDGIVAADPLGIEVDLDQLGRKPHRPVARVLLGEPGTQRQAQIGALDQPPHGGLLLRRACVERVVGGHHALAVEAGHDRGVQRLGQCDHPVGSSPAAAPGKDQRRLRCGRQLSDAGHGCGVRRRQRDRRHTAGVRLIGRSRQNGRQRLHHRRPRPGRDGGQRLVDGGSQRPRRPRLRMVAGDRSERGRLADRLVHPAPLAGVAGHLSRDVQHPQVGGVRLPQSRKRVEGARPGAGDADADPVAGAGVADGGEGGGLLVADDHRANRRGVQRVPQAEGVLSGDPEHHLHPMGLQRAHQQRGTRADGGRFGGRAHADHATRGKPRFAALLLARGDHRDQCIDVGRRQRAERGRHDALAVALGDVLVGVGDRFLDEPVKRNPGRLRVGRELLVQVGADRTRGARRGQRMAARSIRWTRRDSCPARSARRCRRHRSRCRPRTAAR